jgi:hypothetical protein
MDPFHGKCGTRFTNREAGFLEMAWRRTKNVSKFFGAIIARRSGS